MFQKEGFRRSRILQDLRCVERQRKIPVYDNKTIPGNSKERACINEHPIELTNHLARLDAVSHGWRSGGSAARSFDQKIRLIYKAVCFMLEFIVLRYQ